MEHLKELPAHFIYILVASIGGMARYLNAYQASGKFSIFMFAASTFAAGFSGLMFAWVGDALSLPPPMPHIMAGVGGFFGDQTMKLVLEFASRNVKGEDKKT